LRSTKKAKGVDSICKKTICGQQKKTKALTLFEKMPFVVNKKGRGR
jgi:hypothetical protein